MSKRHRGNLGEQHAERWLADRGLKLVERNYQCRAGEIDLVMIDPNPRDTEVLAFIEVRLRGPGARVGSIDSIDERKQRRLISAARHFLMSRPEWQEHACRFDVVGIDGEEGHLRWIPGAFELQG
ncbi:MULTISPECIES: YraN family protein [unclassified Wenzhouxiangella]|uniref:YraN family protein n=1 Tax=unclassified Wenzhouxiangella TaxID=2613841 RepID=UPI000E328334|nr:MULTISPECIES: YraN family protein [unclassified Wenzhouxiangella]RFF26424.1 YraN family protein [Wenzhouxiangella sp. 15181]RFP67303.1 YraN family protein [Wenzhouxiangella sp. 15190]